MYVYVLVLGAFVWLFLLAVYGLVYLGLVVLAAYFGRRLGPGSTVFRLLAALCAALAVAPMACVVLYVPVRSEGHVIKPRFVDNLVLAYAVPWGIAFAVALVLLVVTSNRRRGGSSVARVET